MLEKTPKDDGSGKTERVVISPARMRRMEFLLNGATPFVSNNFGKEMQDKMAENQKKGSQTQKGAKRAPKNFDADYRSSMHFSDDGWIGFPASCLRQAMIDACRTVGYKMTVAKMGVFVLADGFDRDSGQPLVRIIGEPKMFTTYVRLADGSPDIKARARWDKWQIKLIVEFDEDMFSTEDVANLLARVGRQVGIGAGRPFSKTSSGQDWGRFEIADKPERKKGGK
jgi:hypothetical protein